MMAPDPIIKFIGFALMFGVFFDAFSVRMTIVPAHNVSFRRQSLVST